MIFLIKITEHKLLFIDPMAAVIQPNTTVTISISHYPISNSKNSNKIKHSMHIETAYGPYNDVDALRTVEIFKKISNKNNEFKINLIFENSEYCDIIDDNEGIDKDKDI